MIDLEKLRELAEAVNREEDWIAAEDLTDMAWTADRDFIEACSPNVVLELLDHIAALQDEVKEQFRINGMGSEREAALLYKVAQLEKDAGRLDYVITRFAIDGVDGLIEFLVDEDGFVPKSDKARQAIDTAMEASNAKAD